MPKEMGLPKYVKYSDLEGGEKLVDCGEFIGTTQGKYGDQYNFIELKTGQHVVLNKAGSIAWRIEKGDIVEKGVYDITFDGKEKLTKGKFQGKDVNKFKIAVYDPDEVDALGLKGSGRAAGASIGKAPTATVLPDATPPPPQDSQDLDALE